MSRWSYVAPSSVSSVYYDKSCLKFASHHFLLYAVYICYKSLNFTYAFKCYQQNCSWLHFTWTTLYVCLSVCPLVKLENHTTELHQSFACCPWSWLGPPLAALRYVTHSRMTSLSYHWANEPESSTTLCLDEIRQVAVVVPVGRRDNHSVCSSISFKIVNWICSMLHLFRVVVVYV